MLSGSDLEGGFESERTEEGRLRYKRRRARWLPAVCYKNFRTVSDRPRNVVVRSGAWVSSRVSGGTLCLAKWSLVDPSSQFLLFGRSTAVADL
jgi:hypothetical protein